MKIKYKIEKQDLGKSINEILKNHFEISTRLLSKIIKNKKITINGNLCDTRSLTKENDEIEIDLNFEEENDIIPVKMDLDIIYEDEWMLVINKPANIAIHPSAIHFKDSLSNGVKYYFDIIILE